MLDELLKQNLNQLNDDLNQEKTIIQWKQFHFVPLAERQKQANQSTMISLGYTFVITPAVLFYLRNLSEFNLILKIFIIVSVLGLLFDFFVMRPKFLKNEYKITLYQLNFNTKALQITEPNQKAKTHYFQENITLPALSVPNVQRFDYLTLQRNIQQKITDKTGFNFR